MAPVPRSRIRFESFSISVYLAGVRHNGNVLEIRDAGLYCAAGDFFIDPVAPVDRAIVTHAHSDHARPGSRHYLTARDGEILLRTRLGDEASIQAADYGAT